MKSSGLLGITWKADQGGRKESKLVRYTSSPLLFESPKLALAVTLSAQWRELSTIRKTKKEPPLYDKIFVF